MASTSTILCSFVLAVLLSSPLNGQTELELVRELVAPSLYPDAQLEVRMTDGTRADIVTDTWAVEVDRPKKWYEAVTQSLHYARLSHRNPAVVLVVPKSSPYRDWIRCSDCAFLCGQLQIRFNVIPYDPRQDPPALP